MQRPQALSLPPHIQRALALSLSPDGGPLLGLAYHERAALGALITLLDPAAPGAPFTIPADGLAEYLQRSRSTTARYLQALRRAGLLERVSRLDSHRLTPAALAALDLA